MYKITLIFITINLCLVSFLAKANTNESIQTTSYENNYYNGKKFTFIENGITFSVFQNGEFDFYINPKNTIRTNVAYGAVNISYNAGYNYEGYIQYDDYGAIVQIEGVPVYYDYYGRIIGAGNVNINYHSNRLVRIGGLRIYYNGYGYYSHYGGYVNSYNRYYAYNPYHNYFTRPYYNRCVVSYNPYRRHYKPHRYTYHHKKKSYTNHNQYKKNDFKRVDARIRSTKTQGRNNRVDQKNNSGRQNALVNSSSRRSARTNTFKQEPKIASGSNRNSKNTKINSSRATQNKRLQGNYRQENNVSKVRSEQRQLHHSQASTRTRNTSKKTYPQRTTNYKSTKKTNSTNSRNTEKSPKRSLADRSSNRNRKSS